MLSINAVLKAIFGVVLFRVPFSSGLSLLSALAVLLGIYLALSAFADFMLWLESVLNAFFPKTPSTPSHPQTPA